jgi:hypothetical protein
MQLDDFVTRIQQTLPGRVRSIVLFGSAVAGDFIAGVSRYDLLLVLDQIHPADLEALGPLIRRWHAAGHPPPLLFTPDGLRSSADAFAIEFLDLQQSRRVLFGDDLFEGVTIDPAHVRMHLERELRAKSLALRNQYLLAAGDGRRVAELLTDSLSSFMSLFRTSLRLYQPDAPARKLEALSSLARHISFDPQPFQRVEALKEGRLKRREVDLPQLFADYWKAVELICDAIDQRLATVPIAVTTQSDVPRAS